MVDIKLDTGDSTSLKAAFKKNSGTGIYRVLMYLLLISCVTIMALDAAEFISLGLVSDVMGLKVMKVAEFTSMNAAYEEAKTQLAEREQQLAEKEGQVKAGLEERDGLKGQVDNFTGEVENLKKAAADNQNQINVMTREGETLKKYLRTLAAQRVGFQKAAADKQKEINAVIEERDTLQEQLEREQLKKQMDETGDAKAENIAEAVVMGDAAIGPDAEEE